MKRNTITLSYEPPHFVVTYYVNNEAIVGNTFTMPAYDVTVSTELQPITLVIELSEGVSWWSTYLDITLNDLKDAIATAVGSTGTVSIKSKTSSIKYQNGQWRPSNMDFDIREMYQIQVGAACTFTLTGVPVNPTDYPITIHRGSNWIGFLSGESMSVSEAFSGLNPVNGDAVKSKMGTTTFNGTIWRGSFNTLEPGQGYNYHSKATGNKTFTFPTSNR